MNEKIRLEDEELLFMPHTRKRRLYALNSHGIFTVEDFINCDIENLFKNSHRIHSYRAYQRILKSKYRGESLVFDILLDKEYNQNNMIDGEWKNIKYYEDLQTLGIEIDRNQFATYRMIEENYKKSTIDFKVIDVINEFKKYIPDYANIAEFYNEYYKKHMSKEIKISSATIEELKNEIISLLIQKNELDNKISQLIEQVKSREGGNVNNARK